MLIYLCKCEKNGQKFIYSFDSEASTRLKSLLNTFPILKPSVFLKCDIMLQKAINKGSLPMRGINSLIDSEFYDSTMSGILGKREYWYLVSLWDIAANDFYKLNQLEIGLYVNSFAVRKCEYRQIEINQKKCVTEFLLLTVHVVENLARIHVAIIIVLQFCLLTNLIISL